MAFVLDASVTAVWAFADESCNVADAAAESLKSGAALVPQIWWYEIRNLVLTGERRRRIAQPDSIAFFHLLSAYPIRVEPVKDEQTIWRLARDHRLTFYDASYLELALHHHVPLATLDSRLKDAALAAGIPLLALSAFDESPPSAPVPL